MEQSWPLCQETAKSEYLTQDHKCLHYKYVHMRQIDFFFASRLCHIGKLTFHISFIHLSLLMMTSAVLILAVCRVPVTYELI